MLDGIDVTRARPDQLVHVGVGHLPQGRFIFPMLTICENMETGFDCLSAGEKFVPEEIYDLFSSSQDAAEQARRRSIARAVTAVCYCARRYHKTKASSP